MKAKTLYCSVDLHAERSVLGVMLERFYGRYDHARAGWKQSVKEVRTQSRSYREVRVFLELPGIAEIGANVFCAIVEDPWRFKTRKQLWRFCRLEVTSRSSDGKPLGYKRIDKGPDTGNSKT